MSLLFFFFNFPSVSLLFQEGVVEGPDVFQRQSAPGQVHSGMEQGSPAKGDPRARGDLPRADCIFCC